MITYPSIPRFRQEVRARGTWILGILLISCCAVGCQDNSSTFTAERDAAVRKEAQDHDRALAQARADMERQSSEGNAAMNPTAQETPSSAPGHPNMISEEEIGLPIYPNAHLYHMPGDPGSAKVTQGNGIKIALLATPDKPEAVIAFYEPRLTHSTHAQNGSGGTTIVKPARQERTEGGNRIVKFTETLENRAVRIVKITRETDETVIELMNILPSVPSGAAPHPSADQGEGGEAGTSPTVPLPSVPENRNDPLKPPPLVRDPSNP